MDSRIDADLDVTSLGTKALTWVTRRLAGRRKLARLAKEGKTLLGISIDPLITYRHSSAHSHFSRQDPHPDNGDALVTVAGDDYDTAERENRLVTVDELAVGIERSVILIGSPTAEDFSRIVFGYRPGQGENGLRFTGELFDLPYRWELDPTQITATARRVVRGRGWSERPNWSLTGSKEWTPYVGNQDKILTTDFLLVTRIPNFLTPKALGEQHFIVSVAGAHGTGTRAVELLLNDRTILSSIGEELKKLRSPAWYQLVFEVSGLTHREAEGTRARAATLKDAVAIDDDPGMWRDACDAVGPAVLEWQLRHGRFGP